MWALSRVSTLSSNESNKENPTTGDSLEKELESERVCMCDLYGFWVVVFWSFHPEFKYEHSLTYTKATTKSEHHHNVINGPGLKIQPKLKTFLYIPNLNEF